MENETKEVQLTERQLLALKKQPSSQRNVLDLEKIAATTKVE